MIRCGPGEVKTKGKSKTAGGFALVELMIVLTFVGLIIGLVYTLFAFGAMSFQRDQRQAFAQHDARFAARMITDAIRYTLTLAILDDPIAGVAEEALIYAEGGKVIKENSKGEIVLAESEDGIFHLQFHATKVPEPSFTAEESHHGVPEIEFVITCDCGKRTYTINSSVLGLNLMGPEQWESLRGASGSVIRYREVN